MIFKASVQEVSVNEHAYRWHGHLVVKDFTLLLPGFIVQWFKPGDTVEFDVLSEPHIIAGRNTQSAYNR